MTIPHHNKHHHHHRVNVSTHLSVTRRSSSQQMDHNRWTTAISHQPAIQLNVLTTDLTHYKPPVSLDSVSEPDVENYHIHHLHDHHHPQQQQQCHHLKWKSAATLNE